METTLELLDATTEGLAGTLKQTAVWRYLTSDIVKIKDYQLLLTQLFECQSQIESYLAFDQYWQEIGLDRDSRLECLTKDLNKLGYRPSVLLEQPAPCFNRFLAALYLDEWLRTQSNQFFWQLPPHWPKDFFSGAYTNYRWPRVRMYLKSLDLPMQDRLEVSWTAQEILVNMIQKYGNAISRMGAATNLSELRYRA